MIAEPEIGSNHTNNEIIQWGCSYLASHGYTLKSNLPEQVQNTPWSYVIRFATSAGTIYLKHTPALLALEANIIQVLHEQFHASVPEIIAYNPKLNCFLMKDAGQSLRTRLKQQFDMELLCKAIEQFTALQLATANHVDVFLDIGVPDWRLDKLPDLYKELLSQKELLEEDGLSEIEINKLEHLLPKVADLCENLSNYAIKPTIVQPDFNDNNTLFDEASQTITTIDLGEIVISHPFLSLLNCLQQVEKHYGHIVDEDTYLRIKEACLKNYKIYASKAGLLEALETARSVSFVYGMLAQYRLMLACGKDKIMSFQPGKLSDSMKEFIAVCMGIN